MAFFQLNSKSIPQNLAMIDISPNYIAMIEAKRRFPTDTMLEKIAMALEKEPYELFAITPMQKDWQKAVLAELEEFLAQKLKETQCAKK